MTKVERKRLLQTFGLGLSLTLLVVALHSTDSLIDLERWMYDIRAQYFQYFTPAPTNKLIHLDIDDRALDAIGRWPWPRTKIAEIVDEINAADAKALAMDILFIDPQQPRFQEGSPGEPIIQIEDDHAFADAVQRYGKVLLPLQLDLAPKPTPPPLMFAFQRLLEKNLELTLQQAINLLRKETNDYNLDDIEVTNNYFIQARRQAMYNRIDLAFSASDIPPGHNELLAKLLSKEAGETDSIVHRLFNLQFDKVLGIHSLSIFTQPVTGDMAIPLPATEVLPPIPPLASTAAMTGFVDPLQQSDGVVRLLPLWVEYRGRLYPQMGFALACMAMDIDVQKVKIEKERVILPRPGGPPLIVPTRAITIGTGRTYGNFMDLPFFGRPRDWLTSYDYPAHRRPAQHLPITLVTDIIEARDKLAHNNEFADIVLLYFLDSFPGFEAELAEFKKAKIPLTEWAPREALFKAMVANPNFKPLVEQAETEEKDPAKFTDADAKILQYNRNIPLFLERMPQLTSAYNSGRARLKREFGGKAILIGSTATATSDFVSTSTVPRCPGVIIHGIVFNAIMTGDVWQTLPDWMTLAATMALGLMVTVSIAMLPPLTATFFSFSVALLYALANSLLLFDYGNRIMGLAEPLTATIAVWSVLTAWRYLVERRERARIRARFQSYVDPALVSYVEEHPEVVSFAGEQKELTVVFTDLAGFTTISEKLGAKTVPLLNRYMGLMVPVIANHNGIVNKFLGDGIMFFFGAPRESAFHAADAVSTVMKMQEALIPFNKELTEQGLPNVKMRAGVTSGLMVVGDAGPPQRSDYTVLGDVVNLAARLESGNKYTGTLIQISERTVQLLNGLFLVRPLARLQVVGKSEYVQTYEPLAFADDATDLQKLLAHKTQVMIDSYIAAKFEECIAAADALDAMFGESKLAALYRTNCKTYMTNPVADFAGGISLTEK
jgi:class 3 adenylate cyclase